MAQKYTKNAFDYTKTILQKTNQKELYTYIYNLLTQNYDTIRRSQTDLLTRLMVKSSIDHNIRDNMRKYLT